MREMKDSGVEWIGEIPANHSLLRNKYLFEYVKGKIPKSTNTDQIGYPYIGASDLDTNENYTTFTMDEDIPSCRYDDLLVLWDGARADLCGTHKDGKISSTIVRLRAKASYPSFLYWYYKGFESFMYQLVNGTTIPHMNRRYIEQIGWIDWTLEEQENISIYLDAKSSKIDAIIAREQAVIEKLKEYKLSVITEAVTKGLNLDVPMKDSGVEWIGKVPEGWITASFGNGLMLIQTGPFGSQLHAEDYVDNGIYVINPANIIDGIIVPNRQCSITEKKANELSQHMLYPSDIVFARRGEMGRCACYEHDIGSCFCGTGCIKLRCNHLINPQYAIFYLQTTYIRQYLTLNSVGTTMANLNSSIINKIPFLFPSIDEQRKIVKWLHKKIKSIERVITCKQSLITKLT